MPCSIITRKNYRLDDQENHSYYVKLTDEQVRFLAWLCDNDVNPCESELIEMNDIEWEAP